MRAIGDFVCVRTYADMKKKYGVDKFGDVLPCDDTGYIYAEEMAPYGGKRYRVKRVVAKDGYILCGDDYIEQYTFTEAMLEDVSKEN